MDLGRQFFFSAWCWFVDLISPPLVKSYCRNVSIDIALKMRYKPYMVTIWGRQTNFMSRKPIFWLPKSIQNLSGNEVHEQDASLAANIIKLSWLPAEKFKKVFGTGCANTHLQEGRIRRTSCVRPHTYVPHGWLWRRARPYGYSDRNRTVGQSRRLRPIMT